MNPQKETINELHLKFQRCGSNAKLWIRKCQLMLPEIRDKEVWKAKGFTSIYEYAAKLAGMSHNSVNEALRVLDSVVDKPLLKQQVAKYGVNRVKPTVTVATPETQEFWVKKIDEMGNNALQTYVKEYKRQGLHMQGQRLESEIKPESNIEESKESKVSMYMKLDVEIIEKLKKLKGDRDWNELMKDLVEGNLKEPEVSDLDASVPAPVNTGKRYIPAKIKRHVIKQTSGCCSYPGCTKKYEILHHTKRFKLDSTHDPETLRPMCKAHERIAHAGLIDNEEAVPSNWQIRGEPDRDSPKYIVDEAVNHYYQRWKE